MYFAHLGIIKPASCYTYLKKNISKYIRNVNTQGPYQNFYNPKYWKLRTFFGSFSQNKQNTYHLLFTLFPQLLIIYDTEGSKFWQDEIYLMMF